MAEVNKKNKNIAVKKYGRSSKAMEEVKPQKDDSLDKENKIMVLKQKQTQSQIFNPAK